MGNFCTEKYHLFLLSLHFCRLRSSAWAHSEFTCICWPRIRAVELSWVGFMFLHSTLCVCVCFILSITRFPTPDRMRFLLFIRPQNLRGYAATRCPALFHCILNLFYSVPSTFYVLFSFIIFVLVEMQFSTYKHFSVLKNYFGKYFARLISGAKLLFVVIKPALI